MTDHEIAQILQKANDSLRCLFKDYEDMVAPVKRLIREVMAKENIDVLPATIQLMELHKEDETVLLWLMSAAVDLINEKHVGQTRAEKLLSALGMK